MNFTESRWLPIVLLVKFIGLLASGAPRQAWRYAGLREAQRLFLALALATVALLAWRSAVGAKMPTPNVAKK